MNGEDMRVLNLLVKYKLAGSQELQVKEASHIKVDGNGKLMVYNAAVRRTEYLDLKTVCDLSFQTIWEPLPEPVVSAVA